MKDEFSFEVIYKNDTIQLIGRKKNKTKSSFINKMNFSYKINDDTTVTEAKHAAFVKFRSFNAESIFNDTEKSDPNSPFIKSLEAFSGANFLLVNLLKDDFNTILIKKGYQEFRLKFDNLYTLASNEKNPDSSFFTENFFTDLFTLIAGIAPANKKIAPLMEWECQAAEEFGSGRFVKTRYKCEKITNGIIYVTASNNRIKFLSANNHKIKMEGSEVSKMQIDATNGLLIKYKKRTKLLGNVKIGNIDVQMQVVKEIKIKRFG